MPNNLTYPGDVTLGLAEYATEGFGHVFGPDICGRRVSDGDIANAVRLGDAQTLEAAKHLPHGASWELVEATYDAERGVTVASFKPYIDPRQRLRYTGGNITPDELDDLRKLTDADDELTAE